MPGPGLVFQMNPPDGNHVWIVISDEVGGCVLTVNVTDIAHYPDSPCVLQIGDHPAITKRSAIAYRRAKARPARRIDECIAEGTLRRLSNCSPDLLARIIEGARQADDLTPRLQRIYLPPGPTSGSVQG